jgi:hypothetical protein
VRVGVGVGRRLIIGYLKFSFVLEFQQRETRSWEKRIVTPKGNKKERDYERRTKKGSK